MASQLNLLSVAFGVLTFSSLHYSAHSQPGPAERIFQDSIIKNLNDKATCVGAVAVEYAVTPGCSATGKSYTQLCTVAVIGRKVLLGSASCVKNAVKLALICNTNFNFFCTTPEPVLILGMKSTSPADVAAAGVFKISLQTSFFTYHPLYSNSDHDLVAIQLNTEIPAPLCPVPFSIPSGVKDETAYAGPFMTSWGQPQCTLLAETKETYSMAKVTTDCSVAVDGFTPTSDQMCYALKRVQDPNVQPLAAQGDIGAPIYVAVTSGTLGNVVQYILVAILGIFPKSDTTQFPDPFGAGCSKTSTVPAAYLLDADNLAFINSIAALQSNVTKSPIPKQIPNQ